MKDSKYFNLRELTLDLSEILNEVEYLREENAELKKQVADSGLPGRWYPYRWCTAPRRIRRDRYSWYPCRRI